MKQTLDHAIRTLAKEHGIPYALLSAAVAEERATTDPALVQPISGIPEAVIALSALGGKHYLVTHRDRHTATVLLAQCGLLSSFEELVTSDDGLPRKPAPDSCLYLLNRHRIDPATAVMIGDRPLDIRAGKAAGMLGCLLDPDGRFPDEPCDLRIREADELTHLFIAPESLV